MSVEIDVTYQGDLHCVAVHCPSKSALTTDAPVDNGGKGEFFSPTDLVGTALGTCILTIMGNIAKRNNLDIAGTTAHIVKEMASAPVRRISLIGVTITFPKGKTLTKADRAKLEYSAKMCPVKQSLHTDVNVEIKFVYPD